MVYLIDDIFYSGLDFIDLHGYDTETARVCTDDFINDSYILGRKKIIIIHGIGKGILKKEVLSILKNDKRVEEYNLDMFNEGCTLARLKNNIDI